MTKVENRNGSGNGKKKKEKVVIVTGSSRGIGRAIALEFGKTGASLTIHGQSADRLKETKEILLQNGVKEEKIVEVLGPIQERKTVEKIVEKTMKTFGRIDVLVNNAGLVNLPGEDVASLKTFDYVFSVNVRSVIELTDLCVPHLEKAKGNIVNISSVVGIKASSNAKYYSMTKAALDSYMRSMANELGPKGIRVNSVNPGFVATDFAPRSGLMTDDKMMVQMVKNMVIQERAAQPEEIAHMVAFLAGPKASYITGANFVVDGGQLVKG